jgi:hypothetical protein
MAKLRWKPNPDREPPYKAILRRIQMLLEEGDSIGASTSLGARMAQRDCGTRLVELCLTLAECELEPQETVDACVEIDAMQFHCWDKNHVLQYLIKEHQLDPIHRVRTVLRNRWHQAIAS